jgi:hypothetical protein
MLKARTQVPVASTGLETGQPQPTRPGLELMRPPPAERDDPRANFYPS